MNYAVKIFRRFFKLSFFNFTMGFILLLLVIVLAVYSLNEQGFFKIDTIEITARTPASQKNYIASKVKQLQLKLNSFKGIPLWKAPLSQISKALSEEKWIKKFQISRAWPAGIVLNIEPDLIGLVVIPQDTWRASTGQVTEVRPVTQSGNVLEKVKSSEAPDAMVTYDSAFLNNSKLRETAMGVLNSLPKKGSMSAGRISEIGYDKKEGYWVKLLQSETKINFGEDQFEIKSARISQVIDYLESRNLEARVIDANLSKKVLVRLRQNP